MFLFNGNNQNENRSPFLKDTFFQILGVFYIVLAIILVGTNIGRQNKGGDSVLVGKKHTVQVMEGRGVKCVVVGDKDNSVFLEEGV